VVDARVKRLNGMTDGATAGRLRTHPVGWRCRLRNEKLAGLSAYLACTATPAAISKTVNRRRPGSRRPVLQKRASVLLALTAPANPRKLSDLWPTAPADRRTS
jgi:hypothetical protein